MIIVNPSTRQFNIPGADLVFGVTADSGSERKYFQCPRYVGNNLDLAGSFIRMNYRNANGEIDEYLVEDVAVDGDNVTFSWKLTPKVTMYKGNVNFVMCVVGPDTKVKWHTTLGRGQVLEGLEPDNAIVEEGTADVVAALIAMVEAQTEAVEKVGTDQVAVVKAAAKTAQSDAVAEIEAKGVNVRESIPEDYTALSEAVDSVVRGRAGAIVCEAAGSAVVVNDASDLPMQGLRIFGKSTQDGTPTPDTPVEIKSVENPAVTVAGKNLLDITAKTMEKNGLVFTIHEDNSITVNGTATAVTSLYLNKTTLFPAGKYILSGCPTGGSDTRFDLRCNSYRDYGEGKIFTLNDDTELSASVLVRSGATLENVTFYPMLQFVESADTEYVKYSGQTLSTTYILMGVPVVSEGNYTDSEGQSWICDEVDFNRSVYVQRCGMATLGESDVISTMNTVKRLRYGIVGVNNTDALCNITSNRVYNANLDEVHYYLTGTHAWVFVPIDHDLDAVPVKLVYRLATPIETPLSETEIAAYRALHSNYPNTTVLNDSGAHMVVKYAADTKLYIDNKIAALIGG